MRAYLLRTGTGGVAIALAGGLSLIACGTHPPSTGTRGAEGGTQLSAARPRVVVLSAAHRTLAERIGGDAVRVELLESGAGRDPQVPPPRAAILAMQSAERILVNRSAQEQWLEKVALPAGQVVELPGELEDFHAESVGIAHRHGPTGKPHSHAAATLPWLDLESAALQAEAIREALSELLPGQAKAFRERSDALENELMELDRAIQATAARLEDRPFLIVGADLAAFTHRYGLEATVIRETPDGEAELFLQELDRKRGSDPGTVLLLTAPLPPVLQTELGRRGVVVVVLKDGVTSGEGETYTMQLRHNLERLDTIPRIAG